MNRLMLMMIALLAGACAPEGTLSETREAVATRTAAAALEVADEPCSTDDEAEEPVLRRAAPDVRLRLRERVEVPQAQPARRVASPSRVVRSRVARFERDARRARAHTRAGLKADLVQDLDAQIGR